MGRNSQANKEKKMKNADKRSVKVSLISSIVTGVVLLSVTKGCDFYTDWKLANEKVDKRLNNLYTSILLKEGSAGLTIPSINDNRIKKIEFIRSIQKQIHTEAYQKVTSIVGDINGESSDSHWNEIISVHVNLEKGEHIDFPEYMAKAFWQSGLEEGERFVASKRLEIQRPISSLLASEASVPAHIVSYGQGNVEGIVVSRRQISYIPENYPIVPEQQGNKVFIPSYGSLEKLNYFRVDLAGEPVKKNNH